MGTNAGTPVATRNGLGERSEIDRLDPYPRGIKANLGQFSQQTLQVFFVGLTIGMERTVLPTLSGSFGVRSGSYSFLGAFVISFGLIKGLLNFYAGHLSDRKGRKRVMLFGWFAALPIPFLILYAQNWWWIIAANVFLGVNQAFAWTMTITSQVDLAGGRQRGLAVGINECLGYVGVGLAGIATGYLAETFGPRHALFGFGLAVIALGLLGTVFLIRETLPWAHAEQAAPRANSSAPVHAHLAAMPQRPSGFEVFRLVSFRHPSYRALAQGGTANKIADALVWVLFPIFFKNHGVSLALIGWITGAYAMAWGLAQLATGHLSDRIGRKPPIVVGFWLLAAGIAGTSLVAGRAAWLGCAIVMGLGMAMLYPNLIAAVADLTPPAWRGGALGVYRYWRDTGYAIGALILGLAAEASGNVVAAFWLAVIVLFLSGLWIALAVKETHAPAR
jgi:MFS family permease